MPIIWCDIQVIKRFLQPFLLLLSRCWPFTGDAQFNAQIAANNKLRPHLASSTRGKMSIFVHLVIQTCMGNFFFFQITCRKMPPGDPYHSRLKKRMKYFKKMVEQRTILFGIFYSFKKVGIKFLVQKSSIMAGTLV